MVEQRKFLSLHKPSDAVVRLTLRCVRRTTYIGTLPGCSDQQTARATEGIKRRDPAGQTSLRVGGWEIKAEHPSPASFLAGAVSYTEAQSDWTAELQSNGTDDS